MDALNASGAAGEEILMPQNLEKRASAPPGAPFYDTEKTIARRQMPPLEAQGDSTTNIDAFFKEDPY